jgi:hypothetical protein
VSPRESARTTEGREKLVGWLKGLENAHARLEESSVIAVYDTAGYGRNSAFRTCGADSAARNCNE